MVGGYASESDYSYTHPRIDLTLITSTILAEVSEARVMSMLGFHSSFKSGYVVVGGQALKSDLYLERYIESTNKWVKGPALLQQRNYPGVVCFKKKVYVVGGS